MKEIYKSYLEYSPSVQYAIDNDLPVVALESTIITHGMPFPQNLEMANRVEEIVKSSGATPATIAILNGKIKIGLTTDELSFLAKRGQDIPKASRRDLPYLISKNKNGATTVASTMIAADMAGIEVFATGGIGGVHLGGADSLDISADLLELANTNVAVICGGAKAILDLGLTLEYLETHGVPVIGYRTEEFPAFYSRHSGLIVDYRLESAEEIAHFLRTKWSLNLKGGVVIANPIPHEYSMPYDEITKVVDMAVSEAKSIGIKGKDLTPFLLSKIENLTHGKSLDANIELVFNNAQLAADIAVEINCEI